VCLCLYISAHSKASLKWEFGLLKTCMRLALPQKEVSLIPLRHMGSTSDVNSQLMITPVDYCQASGAWALQEWALAHLRPSKSHNTDEAELFHVVLVLQSYIVLVEQSGALTVY
jgi:hypothetical protein